MRTALIVLTLALTLPASAQAPQGQAPSASTPAPVTIESYYRIKWGQHDAFKELYAKNHEPILREMQKRGFVTALRIEEPFTHMAGDARWDFRVAITYRDATTAVGDEPGGWGETVMTVMKQLYPDEKKHIADEARRMGLLEEHWDVIVDSVGD